MQVKFRVAPTTRASTSLNVGRASAEYQVTKSFNAFWWARLECAAGFQGAFELLQTIPEVKEDAAAGILAEVGVDKRVFPSNGHFSSWAGVCPGNRRSAGKDKGGRANKANRWLRGMLTECAWAAAGKKDCYLKGKFWRLAADGKKKAILAVAHNLLRLVYQVLSQSQPYHEKGRPILDERQRQRLIRHHVRALGRLGIGRIRQMNDLGGRLRAFSEQP